MKRLSMWASFSFVLSASLFSCNCNGGNPPDTTPPTVVSTVPAADAPSVAIGTTVRVTFSEPMKVESLDATSFTLSGPGGAVTGTVAASGAVATFTPSAALSNATTYTATISTAAQDLAGNALAAAHSWSFTTAAAGGDTTPPAVQSTAPADLTGGIPVGIVLTVTFTEDMMASSLTTSTFTLTGGGNPVTGAVALTGAIASFTPAAPLDFNTQYTATVTTGAKDLAGNALAADYVWTFTTVPPTGDTTPPTVVSTVPADNASSVATSTTVSVTFSEAMLASSLTTSTFTLSDGSNAVAGAVAVASDTATFTPTAPLDPNVQYTATVTTGAQDLAGNALAANHVWTFRTAAPTGPVTILYERNFDLFAVDENGQNRVTLANTGNQERFLGVAPSGKILYSLAATNLRSVDLDGNNGQQLDFALSGLAFFSFSSTGRVIYGKDGDLWAVGPDGSNKVVLANTSDSEADARAAPGGRVLYLRYSQTTDDRALMSVRDDGTGAVTLDNFAGPKTVYAVTDAGRVFYERSISTGNGYQGDLFVTHAESDGGAPTPVAATTTHSETLAGVAPDGTVGVSKCLLPLCATELLDVSSATFDLERGATRGVTTNNQFIVDMGPLGQWDVKAISTAGVVTPLAASPTAQEIFVAIHPTDRVVYRILVGGTHNDLYSVRSDGTGTVALAATTGDEYFLGFTPSGRVVWGVQLPSGALGSLHSSNIDGADARQLATSTYGMLYAGITASGKVAYYEDRGSGQDLWLVDHDGSAPVNLTNNPTVGQLKYFGSVQ